METLSGFGDINMTDATIPVEPEKIVEKSFILIFPKPFEEQNFLIEVAKHNIFAHVKEIGRLSFHELRWLIQESSVQVLSTSFAESDILFTLRLIELLTWVKRQSTSYKIILCGTCGADQGSMKIGQAVLVEKAYKFDRGFLTPDGPDGYKTRFRAHGAEIPNSVPSRQDFDFQAISLCSNYLMEISAIGLAGNLKLPKIPENRQYILDMETFEFFRVCETMGVHTFHAIRVVSDLYTGKDLNEDLMATKKKIRKNVPMINLAALIHELILIVMPEGVKTMPPSKHHNALRAINKRMRDRFRIDVKPSIDELYGAGSLNIVDASRFIEETSSKAVKRAVSSSTHRAKRRRLSNAGSDTLSSEE
jgi:hypothetical protein